MRAKAKENAFCKEKASSGRRAIKVAVYFFLIPGLMMMAIKRLSRQRHAGNGNGVGLVTRDEEVVVSRVHQ